MRAKTNEEGIYDCWMCGSVMNDASAYLWHINACTNGLGLAMALR